MSISVKALGSLQAAINSAQPGQTIVHDVVTQPNAAVVVNKAVTIIFEQTMDCSLGKDHGIVAAAPGCRLLGVPGVISIANSYLSAILVQEDDFWTNGLSITNYNRSNTNGNAGLFVLGMTKAVQGFQAVNFRSFGGNGNGIRLGNVQDALVIDSCVETTKGLSSEGITINGSDVDIVRTTVVRAFVTGILVYLDRDQSNVRILDCNVIDSSQAVLPPPAGINQVGNNFAVEVQVLQYNLRGLVIDNLCAYDDQTSPTQQGPLKIGNNNLKGTVSLRPPTFTSWGNKAESTQLIFDNQAKEYILLP